MPKVFKKPMVAASLAIYTKKEDSFLVIIRRHNPFKDKYAFPGGFLDVDKENLYETAVRECYEETSVLVKKEDLVLIDIRSDPLRDPRGHVIDVGFFCMVENKHTLSKKTQEAFPQWIQRTQMDRLDFAFDHDLFWTRIKTYIFQSLSFQIKI